MKNYLQGTSKIFMLLMVAWSLNACEELAEALTPATVFISSVIASGPESGGAQTVEVTLNKAIDSDVTFTLEYSGTAVRNDDYLFPSNEITILAGETTVDISFVLLDNNSYEPNANKTVIIDLVTISGEGVNNVTFGEDLILTKHTYNIQEDDMQIDLTWTPSSGTTSDHDLDLYLHQNSSGFRSSTAVSATIETVYLYGTDDNTVYEAIAGYWGTPNVDVSYTITLNYPNGTTQSHSDVFTANDNDDRTLWQITKDGLAFSATKDPFGTSGRIGSVAHTKKK